MIMVQVSMPSAVSVLAAGDALHMPQQMSNFVKGNQCRLMEAVMDLYSGSGPDT